MGTALPATKAVQDPADELRPFPVATLMEQANAILAAIPADHRAATIAAVDGDGASLYAAVRLKHGWTFMGKLSREWGGKLEGQAQLVWSR